MLSIAADWLSPERNRMGAWRISNGMCSSKLPSRLLRNPFDWSNYDRHRAPDERGYPRKRPYALNENSINHSQQASSRLAGRADSCARLPPLPLCANGIVLRAIGHGTDPVSTIERMCDAFNRLSSATPQTFAGGPAMLSVRSLGVSRLMMIAARA